MPRAALQSLWWFAVGVLRADLGIAAPRGVGTADRMVPLVSSVQGASLLADAKKEIAS